AVDLMSAVKGFHILSSHELSKLIRDSENFLLQHTTCNGSSVEIDVEKLARYLPLHLIAMLMSSERDEALFRYLLCGFRLMHNLCDLASRHPKLEQILLDDVKVSEQLLDLIFYLMIILGGYRQEHYTSTPVPVLHPALVACSLYLLTGCISSQWTELSQVLLAHPKVDIFMNAAFAALRGDIKFLQIKLSGQSTDCSKSSSSVEDMLNYLCQQCEASLQFLQSLCQQKLFRERLVKNKELCGKGGVLLLAEAILNLNVSTSIRESYSVVAAVSRLKSKVLSILLHLCEAESVSYLDEVASTPGSLDLAKTVALEVLDLLRTMIVRDLKQQSACSEKTYPKGLLQLNAMRLADIFSDDSNFRSYITIYFTEVLTSIFSLPHGEFLSSWCSSDLPAWEEDATLEYDPPTAAAWILGLLSPDLVNSWSLEATLISSNMPKASYAHQRTSLLVKVMANLHCFVPDICKDEKDLFLHKFLHCLQKELPELSDGFPFASNVQKAAIVSRNLRSLLSHAESLIPTFLNEEDVQLLRVFISQLESLSTPAENETNRVQEVQSAGVCSSPLTRKASPDHCNGSGNLKEDMSENSAVQDVEQFHVWGNSVDQPDNMVRQEKNENKGKAGSDAASFLREIDRNSHNAEPDGSDSSSTRGKNSTDQMDNAEFPQSCELIKESGRREIQEDEKVETVQFEEKQQRKRKRTIMSDKQMMILENALLDEPGMQRNAASLEAWADKLSSLHKFSSNPFPSFVAVNRLNNRKARLARAAKDARAPSEGGVSLPDKQGGSGIGPVYDSPESPVRNIFLPSTARMTHQSESAKTTMRTGLKDNPGSLPPELDTGNAEYVQCEPGQYVVLVDGQGEEVGKGYVYQVHGEWHGRNLEDSETCVVDIGELKVARWARLPHPCQDTGASFDQVEKTLGVIRVLWDSNKLFMLHPR
ncbi:hypothetical protein RJ640_019836, partial [Escallonia rubra]